MNFIDQMHPSFDEHEAQALYDYIHNGGWVTEFKKTREFEEAICSFTGAKYCSIMPNGTISLSVALQAHGIGRGDEVIVPDYTMVATPNSVELIGAKAVFADVERETLCLDYDSMVARVTAYTKAIILVSINGRMPARLADILTYCYENDIIVIEDAAQSLGSYHGDIHVGRFSSIGSFSFSAPKIISTGQGGALITDDENLIKQIRLIRDFGRERGGMDHYLVKGWNYKFTDVQAVIGLEQMKKLEERIRRKKDVYDMYRMGLYNVPQVQLIHTNIYDVVPWFNDILVPDRKGLQEYLKRHGIGTREFYPPLHSEPAYGYSERFLNTEYISSRGLWLPSSIDLTDENVYYICKKISEYYQ